MKSPIDKAKQRAYQLKRIKIRRFHYMSKLGPCVRCGSKDKIELDHIDRSTKITNSIWSWSHERIMSEMRKCQPLCNSCHKIKTLEEMGGYKHNRSGYTRGCRCDKCTKGQIEYMKKYRESARAKKSTTSQITK